MRRIAAVLVCGVLLVSCSSDNRKTVETSIQVGPQELPLQIQQRVTDATNSVCASDKNVGHVKITLYIPGQGSVTRTYDCP